MDIFTRETNKYQNNYSLRHQMVREKVEPKSAESKEFGNRRERGVYTKNDGMME